MREMAGKRGRRRRRRKRRGRERDRCEPPVILRFVQFNDSGKTCSLKHSKHSQFKRFELYTTCCGEREREKGGEREGGGKGGRKREREREGDIKYSRGRASLESWGPW